MLMGAGKPFQMFEYPLPAKIELKLNIMVTRGGWKYWEEAGCSSSQMEGTEAEK